MEDEIPEPIFSGNFSEPIQQDESFINVPILIGYQSLNDVLNKNIPSVILKDDSFDNNNQDNLKLLVEKNGNITVNRKGNNLHFKLPLSVNAEYQLKKPIKLVQPLQCKAVVELISPVKLGANWEIITDIQLHKITWVEPPVIKLAFFSIDLSEQVESIIKKEEIKMLGKLNDIISKEVNLKKEIEKFYNTIQNPITIVKANPQVHLYNQAKSLSVSKIEPIEGGLKIDAIISLNPILVSGEAMPNQVQKVLGQNIPNSNTENGFNLKPIIKLKYEHINALVESQLIGKKLKISGQETEFKKIEIFGDSTFLYCRAEILQPVEGKILLKGKAVFDAEKNELRIDNMDYVIVKAPSYVNIANWVAHDDMKTLLTKKAVFPLGKWLSDTPNLILEAVEKNDISSKVKINFSAFNLTINEIVPQQNHVEISATLLGNTDLKIKKL